MDQYSENPNPSYAFCDDIYSLDQYDYLLDGLPNHQPGDGFGGVGEDQFSYSSSPAVTSSPEKVSFEDPLVAELLVRGGASSSTNAANMNVIQNETRRTKADAQKPQRVAFKTKSKLDVLDDGYRWRKYGKKAVKNSPYLRNYYKCINGGCEVKKIVERWVEDSSYVITEYVGVHNHESSSAYYHNIHHRHCPTN